MWLVVRSLSVTYPRAVLAQSVWPQAGARILLGVCGGGSAAPRGQGSWGRVDWRWQLGSPEPRGAIPLWEEEAGRASLTSCQPVGQVALGRDRAQAAFGGTQPACPLHSGVSCLTAARQPAQSTWALGPQPPGEFSRYVRSGWARGRVEVRGLGQRLSTVLEKKPLWTYRNGGETFALEESTKVLCWFLLDINIRHFIRK